MKFKLRLFLVLFFLVSIIGEARSQTWSTSTGSLYANPTSTKIGIGTPVPSTSLSMCNGVLYLHGHQSLGQFSGGREGRITVDTGSSTAHPFLHFLNANGTQLFVSSSGTLNCKKIHTTEVKISATPYLPDYVFEEDYNLLSLSDVEDFIIQNKHLPDVPSAADVAKDGFEMVEMNMILLRKIEELTLHMIELEKKNDEMQNQLENLK